MTKKIILINASLLKDAACMRRVYLLQLGYKARLNTNDVEFGSSFHSFKSTMRETSGDYQAGKKAALQRFDVPMIIKKDKAYLTPGFLLKTAIDYWEHYNQDEFEVVFDPDTKKPLTELKIALPYMQTDTTEVVLCGTIDEIGKIKGGLYAIADVKTTSSWNPSDYLRSYEMSYQLMFYYFLVKEYGRLFPDTIFGTVTKGTLGIFIDGVFYSPSKETVFKRSPVYQFSIAQMAEYKLCLDLKILQIVRMMDTGKMPPKDGIVTDSCNGKFGRCAFFDVSAAPDDIAAGHILKNEFKQVPYNPLDHNA